NHDHMPVADMVRAILMIFIFIHKYTNGKKNFFFACYAVDNQLLIFYNNNRSHCARVFFLHFFLW
ncbi:MAG: hypothetical protein ORN57_03750, partial [Alphaproteobacteria bacterium]|nr:hypothetical protein [Alphaproteobacteria bacterium]